MNCSSESFLIQPHLLGVDSTHYPGFFIDRPCDPYGTSLILCFRSPATILTAQGMETAGIGDCIIHSTGFRQYHSSVAGAAEGYRNDWLHVSPTGLETLMSRLELPYDRLIPTAQPEVLSPFILRMQRELLTADEFSEAMIGNELEGMLIAICRGRMTAASMQTEMSASERRYFTQFCELRQMLLQECCHSHTISRLASRVSLSPERFAVLYRRFFARSPYAEMLEARLVEAKRLLSSTGLTVKEIAITCGWGDHQYFSRLFRRKTGLAPSEYRKCVLPRVPTTD